MRQVLYYPGILIPDYWLKKTILYSDKISSIFPYNTGTIEGERENLALSNMKYLESEGIYEYLRPEDLDKKTYNDVFIDLKNNLDENTLTNIRDEYKEYGRSYVIYRSKMNEDIFRYLLDNKIAKLDREFHDSILVEMNVGLLYMSLLALHSTEVKKEYITSTDAIDHQNLIFERNKNLENDYYLNLMLNEIPSPSPLSSLEDIIKFKENRRDELLLFRKYINDWTSKIQCGTSNISNFRDDFELYKNQMNEMMKDSGLSIIGSTLEIIIPPLASIVAKYFTDSLDENSVIDITAQTSATFTINRIKSKITNTKKIDGNPLSYLYYAKNNNISI